MGKGRSSSARTFWGRVSPRTGTIIWSAITVVLLGVLIFGVAALSSPKDPTPVTTLTPAEQSDQYYDQALVQESQGNLDQALALAEKAAKTDPNNAQAKALVVRLQAAKKRATAQANGSSTTTTSTQNQSTPPPSTPPTTTTEPTSVFMKPAANLAAFLPTAADGWKFGGVTVVGPDATVAGEPVKGNEALRYVSRALLAVHDRETPTAANDFLNKTIKRLYPKNTANVVIAGTPGYFGTDGGRLATVGFARGRYAYEIVLTAPAGTAASYKEAVVALASACPTNPE